MHAPLPIRAFRERILAEIDRAQELILSAPTGSGKSTQTPQYLIERVPGTILVLEPRRIAARSLAARVAAETKTELGANIGYQVRFEARCAADTKVVYQTYGVFVSRLLRDPLLPGVGAVLLDEFHERTLECDLALAWLKTLRAHGRPDLKIAAMSATLDAGDLSRYLPEAARVDVPGRLFPVDIRYRPPAASEKPEHGALGALRELAREGLDGSVLIFMPGASEIRRTMAVLTPYCREHGLELWALHGSLELAEQQRVLEQSPRRRVIVATNVAETGLTIAQVSAVIDSGLHRVAAYDAARGVNTLYLSRISRGNAAQRAGRAGRTKPGRCVRLWSCGDETGMADALKPEILRLELSALRLQASSLPRPVQWITAPPEAAWNQAGKCLSSLGAQDASGRVTTKGRGLLRYPAPPRLAAVLDAAQNFDFETYERACAMVAVFESAGERRRNSSGNLLALATDLLAGALEDGSWEASGIFRQLKKLRDNRDAAPTPAPGALVRAWLEAFSDRLASREGQGAFYRLADGRGALLDVEKNPPPLILALDVCERAGGGRARQVGISLFLPIDVESVREVFADECAWAPASEFDERSRRVIKEERLMFRGLALARRELAPRGDDRRSTADIWAEKFASGELRHPGLDERALQLVARIALARRLYPNLGYPEMNADDWRLIYSEACAGRNSLKDIERADLLAHIEAYLGQALASHLGRVLPAAKRLPSGKMGRFTYHESRPPELSARLGDFLKMTGTLSLCEGRLPVTFDILAPNHRTVQKTSDLDSFWRNAYPAIKKELQRRYPRHPWP